jgi:LDH2 family malate/lactate/ureidoglycolate dehydrogenase
MPVSLSQARVIWSRIEPVSRHLQGAAGRNALVGAHNTRYTGILSYYAEMATTRDLVVHDRFQRHPLGTPYGGSAARFGTNPICFGFPSSGNPVIWDIGTSEIIHAQVLLARRLARSSRPPGTHRRPDQRGTATRNSTVVTAATAHLAGTGVLHRDSTTVSG